MAAAKISQLVVILGADVAPDADFLTIVDTDAGTTRRISPNNLGLSLDTLSSVTASGTISAKSFSNPNPGASQGTSNEAFGANAGTDLITGGDYNTAIGAQTLTLLTNADYCTACGSYALYVNVAAGNTGIGSFAGRNLTTGASNCAVGTQSMLSGTDAANNVAVGYGAMYFGVSNSHCVAIGQSAGYGSSGASSFTYTVLVGSRAGLGMLTESAGCVGVGYEALKACTTGDFNIAIGYRAADNLTTGSRNIIIGGDVDASAVDVNDELNIGNLVKGTQSATPASKRLGFFGVTPVAQVAHIEDLATNADGTVIAGKVNAILAVLENLGFVLTS